MLSGKEVSANARTLTRVKDVLVGVSVLTVAASAILGRLMARKKAHDVGPEEARVGGADGRRNGEADSFYWRITQWLFPWFTLIPPFGDHALGGHVWVPIDDHHCWAWSINWRHDQPLHADERAHMEAGRGIHCEYDEPGSFRPKQNRDNDYLIDRAAQRDKRAFSGVFGISVQDSSLQESMGPIQDHAAEKLLPTDKGIVMARRMLYEAATGLAAQQAEPPALDAAEQRVRAAGVLLERGQAPQAWAKVHLADATGEPVYSI